MSKQKLMHKIKALVCVGLLLVLGMMTELTVESTPYICLIV